MDPNPTASLRAVLHAYRVGELGGGVWLCAGAPHLPSRAEHTALAMFVMWVVLVCVCCVRVCVQVRVRKCVCVCACPRVPPIGEYPQPHRTPLSFQAKILGPILGSLTE